MAYVSQVMSVLRAVGSRNKAWAAVAGMLAEVIAARYGQMSLWYEISAGVAAFLLAERVPNVKPKTPAAAVPPVPLQAGAPAVRSPEVMH